MKHIRIPVSSGPEEAGWFGWLYMWQWQANGTVGTRLEMNNPRDCHSRDMEWDVPVVAGALGPDHKPMPLEEDSWDIMNDHYPGLRRAGTHQAKYGAHWVSCADLIKA